MVTSRTLGAAGAADSARRSASITRDYRAQERTAPEATKAPGAVRNAGRLEGEAGAEAEDARHQDLLDAALAGDRALRGVDERARVGEPRTREHRAAVHHVEPLRGQGQARSAEPDGLGQAKVEVPEVRITHGVDLRGGQRAQRPVVPRG